MSGRLVVLTHMVTTITLSFPFTPASVASAQPMEKFNSTCGTSVSRRLHDGVSGAVWLAQTAERCPTIQGKAGTWVPRPLFEIELSEGGVERFCSYAWASDERKAPPEPELLRRPELKQVEGDPPIVVPLVAPEPEEEWWETLYGMTEAWLGMADKRPDHPAAASIRVAVLDTAMDAHDPVNRKGHVPAVAQLIEHLACGDLTSCGTELVYYPVVPLMSAREGTINEAGVDELALGTRGYLAAQIEAASSVWEQERDQGAGPSQLIINLSVGWSGCWDNAGQLGTSLVHRSLVRATCRGALIVAAGPIGGVMPGCQALPGWDEAEHLLPGLWGGELVTPQECTREGIVPRTLDEPAPLLFGIGDAGHMGEPPVTLEDPTSLVNYVQGVIRWDELPPYGWPPILAGISMSAGVISGIAAAVWSYEPERSPRELRELLSGSSLYDGGSTCFETRLETLCGALLQLPGVARGVTCDEEVEREVFVCTDGGVRSPLRCWLNWPTPMAGPDICPDCSVERLLPDRPHQFEAPADVEHGTNPGSIH